MKIKFNPWQTPNFVHMQRPPRPRQEGFSTDEGFHVSELDVEDLCQLCDQWRADVFKKAGKADPKAESKEGGK